MGEIQGMETENLGRRSIFVGLLGLLVAGCFVLITAAPAAAQNLPAGCDEYDNPGCVDDDDDVGDDDVGDLGPAGSGDGTGSGDGDGTLPFTGYPLTSLLLLFLALLAAGVMIRAGVAARERLGRSPNAP